ncbi:MAG: Rho termination factor N-terminal domain-containing protein [Acidimicrobiales bacterium]
MNERIDSLNTLLDEVEEDLPAVPKAALRLNRAVTERVIDGSGRFGTVLVETVEDLTEAASNTYKSIARNAPLDVDHLVDVANKYAPVDVDHLVDMATKFAEDTFGFASSSVKTVAGQFGVAIEKTEDVVAETNKTVAKTLTKTAKKVEASETKAEKVALNKMTKAELYEMAKDLDVEGRATMSKSELVKALSKKI